MTRRIIPLLLAFLTTIACEKVHEWPEKGKEVDPTEITTSISISCKIDLDIQSIITKGSTAPVLLNEEAGAYLRRYVIEIIDDSTESPDKIFSQVFMQEVSDRSDLHFKADLHARKYRIAVWMDYVSKERQTDLFYITSEGLGSIGIPDISKYSADSDFKDAQSIIKDLDLTDIKEWFYNIDIEVPLQRPVAKIRFETTDYDVFAKDFTVEYQYVGFLPDKFNVFTQKLNDAGNGYHFTSSPKPMEEKGFALLGFDYVFVNGDSSSLSVTMIIKDSTGKVVNKVENISVPTYRGKETVIRGRFLTQEHPSGAGVDPSFDGEIDIII